MSERHLKKTSQEDISRRHLKKKKGSGSPRKDREAISKAPCGVVGCPSSARAKLAIGSECSRPLAGFEAQQGKAARDVPGGKAAMSWSPANLANFSVLAPAALNPAKTRR
jgi:hypothetical protein